MRLLSFLKQVETTLAMLNPDYADGWSRRADYRTGTASYWHEGSGLALNMRSCDLGDGRFSVQSRWATRDAAVLPERTFFCGASPYDWQSAADAVAEAMPDPSTTPLNAEHGEAPEVFNAASA